MKSIDTLHSLRSCFGWVVMLLAFGFASNANAANHAVGSNTGTVDCKSFAGGVRPGDTITLTGMSRGEIKFQDCYGTASSPITIKNDSSASGPLIVSQSGDGFGSLCTNCEHVVIDGTAKWVGAPAGVCGATNPDGEWRLGTSQCGIVFRCVSGTPQSTLRFAGSSKNVTIKGVEIDGNVPTCTRGIGLSVNDHNYSAKTSNEWREGFVIANNYVHDSGRSGIYFGPNQAKGGIGDIQVRNNEIANNYVNRIGCDGIKYKSAIEGSSSIHHNYVANTGQSTGEHDDGCGSNGISLYESGYTDVFSNYVESPAPVAGGPGNCIAQSTAHLSVNAVRSLPVRIYNNVVHNCKGKGISSNRKDASNPELVPTIYNNTIVAPTGNGGINVDSLVKSCTIRDNVVSGEAITAGQCSTSGNVVDSVAALKFEDAQGNDFRLTANSPAIDGGGSQCPSVDQAGSQRPQGGACDAGAFEFVSGQTTSAKPSPPGQVIVE